MDIQVPSGVSTYVTDASEYIGMTFRFSGETMYSVNYCGDAALYYLNSQGGYDAFLLEGICKRTDKYTQGDCFKAYDNRTIEFGHTRYLTEIEGQWELNTGWLTDEESASLVHNLFPSTRVWLHLLDEDKIVPVVITDTSVQYKTYENQRDKLVEYTIKVSTSQTADRR